MRNIDKAKKALSDISIKLMLSGRKIAFSDDEITEEINDAIIWIYVAEDCDRTYIQGYLSFNGWNDKLRFSVSSRDSLATVKSNIALMICSFYMTLGIEC